jgi:hypothetical protein
MKKFIHFGWMRTGTTLLQEYFKESENIRESIKNRFYSFDPYFEKGKSFYEQKFLNNEIDQFDIVIDSDENYSLGRFKTKLISFKDADFYIKKELEVVYHDIPNMVKRLNLILPEAKVFGVIRKQDEWLKSIYKHDIQHFGIDVTFKRFLNSKLGNDYLRSGNYFEVYSLLSKYFGSHNVKIFLFEDLVSKPDSFAKELSSFLGVKIDENFLKKRSNESINECTLVFLRLVNKIAKRNSIKGESKFYWLFRNLVLKYSLVISKVFTFELFGNESTNLILDSYKLSNKNLALEIGKEMEMKTYGYY